MFLKHSLERKVYFTVSKEILINFTTLRQKLDEGILSK